MYSLREIARKARWQVRRALGKELSHPIEIDVPHECHGSEYGGWMVASEGLGEDTLVFSFGVGGDVSFDLSLIERYGLELHAFDPTPEAAEYVASIDTPPQFHFHPWGLADHDGVARFAAQFEQRGKVRYSHNYSIASDAEERGGGTLELPVYCFDSLVSRLGLSDRRIDIVKMDVEGAEYGALGAMLAGRHRPAQLLIEFHHFLGIGSLDDTRSSLALLAEEGYRTFWVDPRSREFCFLSMDSA